MIQHNASFEGIDNLTLLAFGAGDIVVGALRPGDGDERAFAGVTFKNALAGEVGGARPEFDGETRNMQPDVMLLFNKVESIDVVLESLTRARATLAAALNVAPTEPNSQ